MVDFFVRICLNLINLAFIGCSMLGITKNNQKESTYFAGEEFVIYATCVCLAATFAAGCLGAV